MKKFAILTALIVLVTVLGIPALSASLPVSSTTLAAGEAYQPYTSQIQMSGGNNGYTFRFVSGTLPTGITFSGDTFSGTPRSSGFYSRINVQITDTATGVSETVVFSMYIAPRKITINVDAPDGALYDGVTGYTAAITCFDYYTGDNLTDTLRPTARYGSELLSAATDAGTYFIRVVTPSGCSVQKQTGDTHLIVAGSVVNTLSVTGFSHAYDGNFHGINENHVTLDPANAGWAVEYMHPGESTYKSEEPKAPGVYTARVYTTNPNYALCVATATISITSQKVNFTVWDYVYAYVAGVSRTATLSHDGPEDLAYTVSYTGEDGNTYAAVTKAGVYTMHITIDDPAYALGTVSPVNTLTILGTPVNFTVTDYSHTYSGTPKAATVTADVEAVHFSVIYRNASGEEVTPPTDAGTYSISVSMEEGDYMLGTLDHTTLTISPLPVTFSGDSGTVDYDGQPHTLPLSPSDALAEGNYTLTYRPRGGVTTQASAINAGLYDVGVRFTNGNFTLGGALSQTLTVKAVLSMAPGNSPAAMIYRDSAHASDADWQAATLTDFTTDGRFDSYLPAGCSAGITYHDVGALSPDKNVYTLVVKNTESLTDPGLTVQDGVTTAPVKGVLEPTGTDGLYMLTYTYTAAYGTETRQRYVIVVPDRIGDVNGDGNVNGIDANHLDGHQAPTADFIQGRIWDVTMDGIVDEADAAAIRNRFSLKLTPYYPWIEE